MPLIVQKYGGSSVADAKKIKSVARRVKRTAKKGNKVVVVVSAPGDTTDRLLSSAYEITAHPSEREVDMLLSTGEQISISLLTMALHSLGCPAISFTGSQARILTDTAYTKARILSVDAERIKDELRKGKVVVVAGFQGISQEEDITTLGRGGSDTTAVALAASLKAASCEIYTDVEGIYTADPRVVPSAKRLKKISYDAMLELSSLGAKVMQLRSVELAKRYNVRLHIRSSFSNKEGTMITEKGLEGLEAPEVSGVTYDRDQAKITIQSVPDRPGIASTIFSEIAERNINVDMIIQSASLKGLTDVSFTIAEVDLQKALPAIKEVAKRIKAKGVAASKGVAKVSIVGVGMRSHPGVAARMFSCLAKERINIGMISTSEIKISCAIEEKDVQKAVKSLHREFGLGQK
ncbi:aspartate kinase [bacterium]|nr:aspartate kinase [bacterium]MBU4561472.1 aspartate kinase [bacterium]MCG2675614.1 aspartate kinase [bacterium]